MSTYQSVFTKPRLSSDVNDWRVRRPSCSFSISYFNHTERDLTVVPRNGLKIPLDSTPEYGKHDFIIRVDISLSGNTRVRVLNQIDRADESSENEIVVLKEYLKNQRTDFNGMVSELTLEYPIPIETILTNGGRIYLEDIDIVLGLSEFGKSLVHPFGQKGRILRTFVPKENGSQTGLSIEYEFVENSGKIDRLFVRSGTRVHQLIAVKDPTREEGVYIRNSETYNDVTFVTISDDLMEFGIYKTFADASELGDQLIERKHKSELLRLENSLKEKNIEITAMKAQFDREKFDIERRHQEQLRDIEIQQKKRELEDLERKNRVKDYYEERSYERKDSSEWLKAIPTIITGIAGVFLAFKAFGK